MQQRVQKLYHRGVTQQPENGTFVTYTYEGMPVYIDVPYTSLQEFDDSYDEFYYVVVLADQEADASAVSDQVVKVLDARHQSEGKIISRCRVSRISWNF